MLLRRWTVVDATLIAAPPSTKNADGARDPDMSQTKKGNQCNPLGSLPSDQPRRLAPSYPRSRSFSDLCRVFF